MVKQNKQEIITIRRKLQNTTMEGKEEDREIREQQTGRKREDRKLQTIRKRFRVKRFERYDGYREKKTETGRERESDSQRVRMKE